MKRSLAIIAFALGCWMAAESSAQAQVFVRAPFVRVQVGPGVGIRAPFVNLWLPSNPDPYYYPPGYVPPAPPAGAVPPAGLGPEVAPPPALVAPKAGSDAPPPAAGQQVQALTLDQFAKTFQAKAGSYEVDLVNPVTNQPTRVRFALPEGTPKNVHVRPREIEFRYGVLRFVRIEFDRDGAQVVSR